VTVCELAIKAVQKELNTYAGWCLCACVLLRRLDKLCVTTLRDVCLLCLLFDFL
jgi:hypothetical protein